ncbi:MAG TPA: Na+/H+ antiporter NhaA [Solirubrobacterales bacterium]|jgi:NhaA family Na+:H+ antiporter|nr:Na+/H+ antiporter NhaA [Solirubrobacterales bacterium]
MRDLLRADFLRAEAGGGLALLLGSVAALLWVNVIDAGGYASFWATHLNVGIGAAAIDESLGHWVNDGLMTLFFFLISLEIKRELVTGELRHPKRAALPIIAALGGVVTPIAVFLLISGGHHASGWGIPMATDAAFAIGVLALLGDRVGVGVKLFLVTIAVVDDVGAILVIAVAYTDHLSLGWLALAVLGLLGVVGLRLLGARRILLFVPLGLFVWVATFESGIHATLAGVALALITPATPVAGRDVLGELEHRLHPWVNYAILPLFALANAGVKLGGGELSDSDGRRIALAVALGLVVGKFVGIAGATTAALKLRLGALPSGVDLGGLLGAAALGGIGFTVSLFITPLAYDDPLLAGAAKLGILGGSLVSAVIGITIFAASGVHPTREEGTGET